MSTDARAGKFPINLYNEIEGHKDDAGKARWDLVPWEAMGTVVQVLTVGAGKYGPENWRCVPNSRGRYFAAALRHLMAWQGGEERDRETGLPHLAHAVCCMLFLLAGKGPDEPGEG